MVKKKNRSKQFLSPPVLLNKMVKQTQQISTDQFFLKKNLVKKKKGSITNQFEKKKIDISLPINRKHNSVGISNSIKKEAVLTPITMQEKVKEEEINKAFDMSESLLAQELDIEATISETSLDENDLHINEEEYFHYDNDKCMIEKVQIFGTPNGRKVIPILTDDEGKLKISGDIIITPIYFREKIIRDLVTSNEYQYTETFDVKDDEKTSFIIVNRNSTNEVKAYLQNSPDHLLFQIDVPEVIIAPLSFKILTPTRFIRYQRIAYRSAAINHPAKIDVYFQAQGNVKKE